MTRSRRADVSPGMLPLPSAAPGVRRRTGRMLRCSSKLALAVAATILNTAADSGSMPPEDLVCPPSTQYKRIEFKDEGVFAENCRDALSQRQGPYRFRRLSDGSIEAEGTYLNNRQSGDERYYDADGELLHTTPFRDGAAGSQQFTRAGLRVLSKQVNEYLVRDGKQVLVYPSGEGGLTLEHRMELPYVRLSSRGPQLFRERLVPLMCGLLTRHPGLKSINVRILWATGQVASAEKIRDRQCLAAAGPSTPSIPSLSAGPAPSGKLPLPKGASHAER